MDDIRNMTTEQLEQLLAQRQEADRQAAEDKRKAYEATKAEFLSALESRTRETVAAVREFYDFVVMETGAFYELMRDYGALRSTAQRGYAIQNERFKIEVKSNKVKGFDERADIAAGRLIEFLNSWIQGRDHGADDPMYQLAMAMLERNRYGDLDYKSISKLYELERRFNDPEYSEIMQLFKESNVVERMAVNFYFYERTNMGSWRKLEPSFNRM